MSECCLVITTCPNRELADALTVRLVDERLAACVQASEIVSRYRWRGAVEQAAEIRLEIKTRSALYPRVQELIRQLHPYEVPEILAVPVRAGLPAYLEWIAVETGAHFG